MGQDVCNREIIDTAYNNLITLVGGYNPQNLNQVCVINDLK